MLRIRLTQVFALIVAFACVSPCFAQREKFSSEDLNIIVEKYPTAKKMITGLRYIIQKEGMGDYARPGDLITVLYKGSLLDGRVFNECLDPAKPFVFRLGRGNVIEAWEQALKLTNEGAKMTIIVPFELGYGTRGNPPLVPRQATLIFEVEVLKIERGSATPAVLAPTKEKK